MLPSELMPITDCLFKMLSNNQFAELDNGLATIPVTQTEPEVLVVILRTTYPVRELLKSWNALLENTAAHFKANGLDSENLLRGLS